VEGVAFWVGVAVLAVGLVLMLVSAGRARRGRRDRARVGSSTRSGARDGRLVPGPVALSGKVASGPDGLTTEPLTGSDVVWYRLTAFAPRAGARSQNDHVEVHSESDGRDFVLDDGTRSAPLVSVDDAGFVVPMDIYGDVAATGSSDLPWDQHHLTAQHVVALRARCARPTSRMIRADSHTLAPGTAVTVVGWLERGATGPTLVGRSPDHPLIVYAVGDEAGRPEPGRPWRVAATGVLLIVAGALGIWWASMGLG
jgi:hypothetical protein